MLQKTVTKVNSRTKRSVPAMSRVSVWEKAKESWLLKNGKGGIKLKKIRSEWSRRLPKLK